MRYCKIKLMIYAVMHASKDVDEYPSFYIHQNLVLTWNIWNGYFDIFRLDMRFFCVVDSEHPSFVTQRNMGMMTDLPL